MIFSRVVKMRRRSAYIKEARAFGSGGMRLCDVPVCHTHSDYLCIRMIGIDISLKTYTYTSKFYQGNTYCQPIDDKQQPYFMALTFSDITHTSLINRCASFHHGYAQGGAVNGMPVLKVWLPHSLSPTHIFI